MRKALSVLRLLAIAGTAILLSLAWAVPEAHAEIIKHIRIEGAQRIEPATIQSYIDIQSGDSFDQDKLDHALKNLYATGLFADVSLYQEGQDLVIVVVENPIINQVAFEGNSKVKEEDLKNETQLKPRNVLTRTKVQADVERLQEVYRVGGYFSADVQAKIIKLDQNRVNLIYEIHEGTPTYISRVSFVGNRHYDESQLQKVIRSREERWWRFWSSDDKYDPDRLAYDRELLRNFYLDHGYADFRVENAVAELSPDHKNFYVTFVLDEGERYKVGTVDVKSFIPEVDAKLYAKNVTFKKGDWYNASELEKSNNALTDALGNKAHPFIDVRPDVQRNHDKRTIDVAFNINEGKKVFVENINISGNVRTLDEVIRREITMSEGDAFNQTRMKKSEQRLKDLGFFDTATIKATPGSAPDKTNLDVQVAEKSTGELSLGAGFSTSDGPLGDFSIKEKNFLGKGQEFDLSTTIAKKRTAFDFSFTEPYFLKRDLSAGIDLFHSTTDYQSESHYDYKRTGGGFHFGYPLSDKWRQNVSYAYSDNTISNVPTTASIYIKAQAGRRTSSTVAQRLTYDTTDSHQDPTEGMLTRIDLEGTGLGGESHYGKVRVGTTYYYPIIDKWVFSAIGEGGYMHGWDGETVHINERFYIGGANLRGFMDSGIGPRDSSTRDALGGDIFYRGSGQVEFPSGLPEDLGVRLHVFSDAGSLWKVDDTGPTVVDDNVLRVSAGGGISWRSPMGPVQADLAWPLKKAPLDRTEVFRFNFGTRF
jgi:outer membrane protein insertion porin family